MILTTCFVEFTLASRVNPQDYRKYFWIVQFVAIVSANCCYGKTNNGTVINHADKNISKEKWIQELINNRTPLGGACYLFWAEILFYILCFANISHPSHKLVEIINHGGNATLALCLFSRSGWFWNKFAWRQVKTYFKMPVDNVFSSSSSFKDFNYTNI